MRAKPWPRTLPPVWSVLRIRVLLRLLLLLLLLHLLQRAKRDFGFVQKRPEQNLEKRAQRRRREQLIFQGCTFFLACSRCVSPARICQMGEGEEDCTQRCQDMCESDVYCCWWLRSRATRALPVRTRGVAQTHLTGMFCGRPRDRMQYLTVTEE